MIEDPSSEEPTQRDRSTKLTVRTILVVAAVVFVGGLVVGLLGGLGVLAIPASSVIILTVLLVAVLACCSTITRLFQVSKRMPLYSEMEARFEQGKMLFDNGEWAQSLEVFLELAGPKKDHKRALYYAARCYENLEQWSQAKEHYRLYLKLQPKDKEVWHSLAQAHRKMFEYEQADEADRIAAGLR
jgi:tetratricopeptide (TPR) repeat protein